MVRKMFSHYPRPPWSWPLRLIMFVLCFAALVIFLYVMAQL